MTLGEDRATIFLQRLPCLHQVFKRMGIDGGAQKAFLIIAELFVTDRLRKRVVHSLVTSTDSNGQSQYNSSTNDHGNKKVKHHDSGKR